MPSTSIRRTLKSVRLLLLAAPLLAVLVISAKSIFSQQPIRTLELANGYAECHIFS